MSADPHDLAGAYALHALPDLERARYERHLATCEVCRADVGSYLEVAAQLGAAVELAPPPGLRDRVLAEVAALAPPPAPPRPALAPAPAPALAAAAAAPAPPGRRRWLAPVAASLASAAVAVGVTLLGVRLADRPDPADRALAILTQPGATTTPLESEAGVAGNLVAAPGADEAVVVLAEAPGDEGTLTLWTIRDGAPVWEQPLDAPAPGDATVAVLDDVDDVAGVAVSLEPDAERADAPRGPILGQAALPG